MANRNFPNNKIYNTHIKPVALDMQVSIGASGAPTIVPPGSLSQQPGITSITRLKAGVYQMQLNDNFADLIDLEIAMESPVTGSAIAGGSFVATTVYQIVTLGTTTQAQWVTAGVPSGITAAPGVVFLAAGVGAGTGTVKALGNSGITTVEIIGATKLMLNNQPFVALSGGYVTFQCLAPTSSSVTTMIPTDPANGSVMYINMLLSDSQVQ